MTDARSEFARLIEPVACELLGCEPNRSLSTKTELRFGSRGSFAVDLKAGTWFDHEAGDKGGGVLDLLKARMGLEKSDALQWLRDRKHLPPETFNGMRIVQAYDYTDAAGNLVFQVVRLDPKDFRQRRPDPANPGKWIWKTAGLQLPLYRLPEVRSAVAAGQTVYVAEGEKGAEKLRALGVVATCSPGGAGKWRAHHTPQLAGADVVLLPDNDEPGRAHVAKVAKAVRGVAKRVRVLALPALPEKGDVFDWIEAGGTRDALENLLAVAPIENAPLDAQPEEKAAGELRFIEPHKLQGVSVPVREWIVEDWLPCGAATLLFGDGGTGKTLLAQQLMTSCATGKPWIGLAVSRCRSLALFCEDDPDELHRRQDRINRAYGVEFDDLDDMTWSSGVGQDNALMRFHADGRPQFLERLSSLKAIAITFQARLVILDTAADIFGGNENDRGQVRNFLGAMNAFAKEIGGAILINAHPSRSGLSVTGDLDGGSTAWSNTARSRWSLARPKADNDETPDPNERALVRRKANYASIGDELRLRWNDGALAPIGRPGRFAAMAAASDADGVFLTLLARCNAEGRPLSDSRNAGNSAPKLFGQRPDRQGFNRRDFEAAMQRLFAAGRIRMAEYGRPSAKGMPRRIVAVEGAADG